MGDLLRFLLLTAIDAGAYVVGRAAGRRGRRAALAVAGTALVVLVAKAILHRNPAWEAALLPFPWYVRLQRAAFFGPVFLFMGAVLTQEIPERRRRFVRAFAIALFIWGMFDRSWLLVPPEADAGRRADARLHCRQSTVYTCSPSACVTLLAHWGVDATEGEMARLCRTRRGEGTLLYDVFRGLLLRLQDEPFRVRLREITAEELRATGLPAVIAIGPGHTGAVDFRGQDVVVHDPLHPTPDRITFEAFRRRFSGEAVIVLPDDGSLPLAHE